MTGKDKNFYSDNIFVESLEYGDQATHFMSHGHIVQQYLSSNVRRFDSLDP